MALNHVGVAIHKPTAASMLAAIGQTEAAGVRNELVVFEGRHHGFDFHPLDWEACFERVCAFLDSALKEPAPHLRQRKGPC